MTSYAPELILSLTNTNQNCLILAILSQNINLFLKIFRKMKDIRPNLDFLSQRDKDGRNVFSYLILKNQYMIMIYLIAEVLRSRSDRDVLALENLPYEPKEGGLILFFYRSL